MKHEPVTSHTTNYAHQIWLASIGMVGTIQKKGSELFSELVKEGKNVEARSRATQTHRHAKDVGLAEAVMAAKETYQKKFEVQLQEWDAQLDQLTVRAKKAKADARSKIEDELNSLKTQRAAVQQQLDELRNRSEDAWEDLKDGVEKAWGEISDALGKVVARFK
jgi:chromosome segregation ATPase